MLKGMKGFLQTNKISRTDIFKVNLYFFVGSLPLWRELNTILLWPFVLSWFFVSSFKTKVELLVFNRFSFLAILGIHLLYWIGLLISENTELGFVYIEHTLALIIIPLIIFSSEKSLFSIKKIFISLGIGIGAVMIISWTYIITDILSATNPIEQSKYFFEWLYTDWNLFKYVDIHPTYFSLMLVLFTSTLIFEKSFSNFRDHKIKFGITVFLLILFLIEANSRISLIGFIMIIASMGIKQFDKKGILVLLLIIVLIIIIGSQFDYLAAKFSKVFDGNGNLNFERLLRWKEIINVFLEKNQLFFGVGSGDAKKIFNEAYVNGHFNLALNQGYNAHNQYLEFFVSNGILGLFVYTSSLIYFAIKTNLKSVAFIFLLVIILFSFTESFLDRSKGVFFFATFFSLLLNIYGKPSNEETT